MTPRRCGSCGSGAEADAGFCWLCGYPLGTQASPAPAVSQVTTSPPLEGYVWVIGFVLALFVMLGVAVELALLWPGLLIPYAVAVVPVVAVLARIAYVQRLDFWKERAPSETRTAAPAIAATGQAGDSGDTSHRGDGSSDVVGEVVTAIAIGMAGVMVVVGILILLAVAAFVILIAICLGMLAAYGGGY